MLVVHTAIFDSSFSTHQVDEYIKYEYRILIRAKLFFFLHKCVNGRFEPCYCVNGKAQPSKFRQSFGKAKDFKDIYMYIYIYRQR